MDYLPSFRRNLTQPLIRDGSEGVSEVIDKLVHYDLLREDYDSILEVTQWPNKPDPTKSIDSKVRRESYLSNPFFIVKYFNDQILL